MDALLKVKNLHVTFTSQKKRVYAVRGIDFDLAAGQKIGIVGESGSGKSAAAQAIQHLSLGQVSGEIQFLNQVLDHVHPQIGYIFQDPMSALNPTMKIKDQIAEGLIYHKILKKTQAYDQALELLKLVQVNFPEMRMNQYPFELSGGQRQRVLIAIAIACSPKLLIADEPTTALDGSIQKEILRLIKELCREFSMGLILISHDFHVIKEVCDQIMVMYAGKIVEKGNTQDVIHNPKHPYTKMLIESTFDINQPKTTPLHPIKGSPPDLSILRPGCSFMDRCPFKAIKCLQEPDGDIACWRVK